MKKVFVFILLLFASLYSFAQFNGPVYLEFEEGKTYQLFGDNVKLRAGPTTAAEVLDVLAIGSSVRILERSEETLNYNGRDWNWYKVDFQGQKGFLCGGLLALYTLDLSNGKGLYTISVKDDWQPTGHIRLVKTGQEYKQFDFPVDNQNTELTATGSRGLSGVHNVLHLNYFAEACGVNGGGMYLFYDGEKFSDPLNYTNISEAGLFWQQEKWIFPDEEGGKAGKLVFQLYLEQQEEEETDWKRTQSSSRAYQWTAAGLVPAFKKDDHTN